MPQAGLLLQTDGSRHDWLAERGPRLTLVAAIDDATGVVTGATFREQEDAAGYLTVLRDTIRRHGVPLAVYRDRHGIFETPKGQPLTLGSAAPSVGSVAVPATTHPWRRVQPGTKLYERIEKERLSGSRIR